MTGFESKRQMAKAKLEQPEQAEPCVGKDPRCPCQDGDACHYKDCGGTKAKCAKEYAEWKEKYDQQQAKLRSATHDL